ncbi:MAG: hypothetical protein HOI47_20995 [Candidatus Scalindua sp.]|nr:hypothetical protein [Candidatus Scalindua sp.]
MKRSILKYHKRPPDAVIINKITTNGENYEKAFAGSTVTSFTVHAVPMQV